MSEDMVNDGYEEIVNVDISTVAIDMMKRKYEHVPQMKCMVAEETSQFWFRSLFTVLMRQIFVIKIS